MVSRAENGKKKTLEFARYISPVGTFEAGLWPKLGKAQQTLANKQCLQTLKKVQPNLAAHLDKRGTCFDLAFVTFPNGAGIQPGPMAKRNNPEMVELNSILIFLYKKLMKIAFPQWEKDAFKQSWASDASITIDDNLDISSIQVNFSRLDQTLEKGLKCKAHIHIDKNDDPARLSLILFLSKFPKDVFPGRFNITSARLTCSAETFGALVVTARHPHCGSGVGKYPEDLSLDCNLRVSLPRGLEYPALPNEDFPDVRITTILYPRKSCMQQGGIPLFHLDKNIALGAFTTRRAQQEFLARKSVQQGFSRSQTPFQIQRLFSWKNEDGSTSYPRLDIIQMALKYQGHKNQELEEQREAAKYAGCGSVAPDAKAKRIKKAADDALAKVGKAKRKEEALAAGKVQCIQYIARRNKQCETFMFPKGGVNKCWRHSKDVAPREETASSGMETRTIAPRMKKRIKLTHEEDEFLDDSETEAGDSAGQDPDAEWREDHQLDDGYWVIKDDEEDETSSSELERPDVQSEEDNEVEVDNNFWDHELSDVEDPGDDQEDEVRPIAESSDESGSWWPSWW